MRFLQYKKSKVSGLTILEIVICIGILGLITGGIIAFERNIITTTKVLQTTLVSQRQVRKTMTTFASELRSSVVSANGSYNIESAGTSSIVFYANIDNATDTERIRYFLATSTGTTSIRVIKRGVTKPTGTTYATTTNEKISTVVNDIRYATSTAIFTYYDKTYNGTSSTTPLAVPINIPDIRLVKLTLPVDPNAARSPVFQIYTTQIMIRNLKDNY